MMNWTGLGRKHSWPSQGIIPTFAWKDWGKPWHCQHNWCQGHDSNTYMHTTNIGLRELLLYQTAESYLLLLKQQFVVTHTIHQSEIPALLDRWVTNTPSVKMLCPQKNCFSIYFCKNISCLNVVQLIILQVSSVSCKIVYWWVTKNCCCMSFMTIQNESVGGFRYTVLLAKCL
jgi:hypothetical protein